MKLAQIIPLYKGKDRDKRINYRPVSLLITMSEVLEKIIYKQMYGFLTQHIFFESQYRFWDKRSCEQAIAELTGHIIQSKNAKEHCAGLFLDLLKAFDTLNHGVLLCKLDRYGVCGVANDWFKSHLENRKLRTWIHAPPNEIVYSFVYNITYRTAQGSCLGPLLFILFCNDIYQLPIFGKLILFADDTRLFTSHKNKKFLRYMIEHDLMLMSEWFKANQLSLNMAKSSIIKFWSGGEDFSITLDGVMIPQVSNTKFLGVHIDENLTWEHQASHLYNKLTTNQHLLRMLQNVLDVDSQ